MKRLFSLENIKDDTIQLDKDNELLKDISEDIDDSTDSLNIVTEAFRNVSNELFLVNDISTSLNDKK